MYYFDGFQIKIDLDSAVLTFNRPRADSIKLKWARGDRKNYAEFELLPGLGFEKIYYFTGEIHKINSPNHRTYHFVFGLENEGKGLVISDQGKRYRLKRFNSTSFDRFKMTFDGVTPITLDSFETEQCDFTSSKLAKITEHVRIAGH